MTQFSCDLDLIRKDFLRKGHYFKLPGEDLIKPSYEHINNGFCAVFANTVKDLYPSAELLTESDIGIKEPPHCFIKYNGLYYDAEAIYGINSPYDLPLFKSYNPILEF